MKNTKKLLVGVLSVAALLGTGVAAWTIGGELTTHTETLDPTVVYTIGTRDIALKVSKDEADTIKFDSVPDFDITYNVKAEAAVGAVEGFNPYDLTNFKNVAEEYQPDLTVTTKAYDVTDPEKRVELKTDDPFYDYVKLPEVQTIDYDIWLASEEAGYDVTLKFAWSDIGNPQKYVDSTLANKSAAEQRKFIEDVIAALKNVQFEFVFEVKGVEGEDVPPVTEETGTVTLPTVEGSTLSIEGLENGKLPVGEHVITITTDEGKIVKDNNLTVIENGENKPVGLTESSVARATTHTYTATYNFVADATYSFKYEVVDETPDEPDPVTKYKVTFSATEGGTIDVKVDDISITSGAEVEEDKKAVVTVAADNGYKLTELTVNGVVQALEGATLTLTVDKALDIKVTFEKEDMPSELVVFEEGKLGLWQSTLGVDYYFSGTKLNYYFVATTNFEEAVNITSYKTVDNKYYLQIEDGENKGKYIGTIISGEYNNLEIVDEPYAWTYNESYQTYFANIDGKDYFIGNYGNQNFISLNSTDFIDNPGENIARIVKDKIQNPNPDTGLVSSFTREISYGNLTDGVLSFTVDDKFNVEHSKGANKSNAVTNEYEQWRIYKDHYVTISSEAYLIEKITFTDTNDKTNFSINAISNNFTATLAEGTRNWTLTANEGGVSSLTFSPGQQIRILTMKIYYIEK